MLHYFFGHPERQLFGVYHPPDINKDRMRCILICNAFGHEYLRSHWAMRQIAMKLSAGGYHVLRFDYSCTGDSAGAVKDSNVEQWIEDVETAIYELQDISGKDKVDILSLRLGTWFAVQAAKSIKSITKLVLWDPILSGPEYVLNLRKIYKTMCSRSTNYSIKGAPAKLPVIPEEVLGLKTADQITEFIKNIDIINDLSTVHNDTYAVLSHLVSSQSDQFQLIANTDTRTVSCKVCEDIIDWKSYDNLGTIIYPTDSIKYICKNIFL